MKEEITFCQFCDRFRDMNRNNNFTYDGKKALFEYLESYEEDTDTKIELDIIALCCEYTEYNDLDEYLENYSTDIQRDEFENNEDFHKAIMEEISNNTTLIKIENTEGFIIQAY